MNDTGFLTLFIALVIIACSYLLLQVAKLKNKIKQLERMGLENLNAAVTSMDGTVSDKIIPAVDKAVGSITEPHPTQAQIDALTSRVISLNTVLGSQAQRLQDAVDLANAAPAPPPEPAPPTP